MAQSLLPRDSTRSKIPRRLCLWNKPNFTPMATVKLRTSSQKQSRSTPQLSFVRILGDCCGCDGSIAGFAGDGQREMGQFHCAVGADLARNRTLQQTRQSRRPRSFGSIDQPSSCRLIQRRQTRRKNETYGQIVRPVWRFPVNQPYKSAIGAWLEVTCLDLIYHA